MRLVLLLSSLLVASACTELSESLGVPEQVGYQAHVRPMFEKRCSSCHNQYVPAMNWMDYETARKNRAKILRRVVSRTMPPGQPLTKEEIELVKAWVKQGAKP